jgi:hypothetical protein
MAAPGFELKGVVEGLFVLGWVFVFSVNFDWFWLGCGCHGPADLCGDSQDG